MSVRIVACCCAVLTSLACAAPARGAPARPADLRVAGGSESWHADNAFVLSWANPADADPPLATTHYRLRDPDGEEIEAVEYGWVRETISALAVPDEPGIYTVEVWLEDSAGAEGAAASAALRYDDTAPGPTGLVAPQGWVGRDDFPLRVRFDHPPGPPWPLAGIRGYAVALGTAPCAAADRCSETETTLRGGVGDDELELAALPEGESELHAVAVSGSGIRSRQAALATLRVDTHDPVTRLRGAPAGWSNRALQLRAEARDDGSGMDGGGAFTAVRIDDGAPVIATGAAATSEAIAEGEHRVAYYARDAAGNADDGAGANRAPRTATVRIDRTPPALGFENALDPFDRELLRVRVADGLSGPAPERGWIGVRRLGSGDRFERLPPAPAPSGELRARWDSDAGPRGRYEFRAVGYDIAGNAAVTGRRRNGTPMTLSSPLKLATAVRAAFQRGARGRTVPYGRRLLLRGRLFRGRRPAPAGMPLRVVERFAPGARPATRVSIAATRHGGSFAIRNSAGPSRAIEVAFDGTPSLARSAAAPIELRVRSRVLLRTSARTAHVGGAPLVFSGRLVAPRGTTRLAGRTVQLQFRVAGLPWSEFRTLASDRRGRFRYAYRFRDDDSRGARFQFRAHVPAQEDWPYEPAGSLPVLVQGR